MNKEEFEKSVRDMQEYVSRELDRATENQYSRLLALSSALELILEPEPARGWHMVTKNEHNSFPVASCHTDFDESYEDCMEAAKLHIHLAQKGSSEHEGFVFEDYSVSHMIEPRLDQEGVWEVGQVRYRNSSGHIQIEERVYIMTSEKKEELVH